MAGITKNELSARRQRLRDELPNHGWDYVKAGIAAGYSQAYAKTHLKGRVTQDVSFCQQVEAKRAEINAKSEDKREGCLRVLDSIIFDEKAAPRDRIKATETRGKMCGWLSETRVMEVASRQRELSEAEREEAREYALWRLDTMRLPDKSGPRIDDIEEARANDPASTESTPDAGNLPVVRQGYP